MNTASMDIWRNTESCTQVQSRFTILELAMTGTYSLEAALVDRLAMDVAMSCDGSPPFTLSYRFRSSVPLTR